MPALGVPRDVSERLLGHAQHVLDRVYDHHDYTPQVRAALEAWERRLDGIVARRKLAGCAAPGAGGRAMINKETPYKGTGNPGYALAQTLACIRAGQPVPEWCLPVLAKMCDGWLTSSGRDADATLAAMGLHRRWRKALHQDDDALRVAAEGPRGLAAAEAPTYDRQAQHWVLSVYAADLHSRRVAQLAAGEGPTRIMDGSALVMHVVPFGAVGDRPSDAFVEISRDPHKLPPMSTSYGHDSRSSYEGLLVGSNADGLSKPQRAYIFVSRAAAIEAVESSLARGPKHDLLQLPALQATIIKYASVYARILRWISICLPTTRCLHLTRLINVQGMKLHQDFIARGAFPEDLPSTELDRSQFDFGQAIFEVLPQNYIEAAKALKPPPNTPRGTVPVPPAFLRKLSKLFHPGTTLSDNERDAIMYELSDLLNASK